MQRIAGTNVEITGTQESNLATTLKWFKDNETTTAGGLITTASNNNLKIKVTNSGGKCHALGSDKVELDWAGCNNDIDELAETALFELNNAANFANYDMARNRLRKYTYSLLEYGYQMAIRETSSSIALNTILLALGTGYTPSQFGRGHMTKNALASPTNPLEQIFADSKQVETATVGSDSLKSKHLYGYDALKIIGKNFASAGGHIKRITNNITTSGGNQVYTTGANASDYSTKILKYFSNRYTLVDNDYPALKKLIVSYILALQILQVTHTWTITWNGNGAEWLTYANEVARADSIVVGGWPAEIANKFVADFP